MSNSAVGSYSVSVSFSLPWKKEGLKAKISEGKKRKKIIKPIINPIFEKCASLTEDKFWQVIFMECARGKFPRGFTFKNNLLTHKKGNKLTCLELNNSPTEVFIATINFFQTVAGIMSNSDRQKLQKQEEEKIIEQMDEEEITWKQIRKENLKDILLNEFVCDMCQKMDFNQDEKKELITTIKKGIMLKCFNADNIIMEDGKIVEIDGLIYNEKTREYEIDQSYMKKYGRKESSLGIEKDDQKIDIDFLEMWRKYLESLETKRSKKMTSFSVTHNDDTEESFSKTNYSFTS